MSIIIVADSSYPNLRFMTQKAIDSCVASEIIDFDIIVIDGNQSSVGFQNAKTIVYEFEFNYNKCLNLGIRFTNPHNDLIALCNNDLIFRPGWATNIQNAMGDRYLSACPFNYQHKNIHNRGFKEGYEIEKEILGWCIVIRREVLKRIGSLDETCKFWYSDNIYGEQIKRAGIRHILVYDSHVLHLKNKTLNKYPNKFDITIEQKKIFQQWKQY